MLTQKDKTDLANATARRNAQVELSAHQDKVRQLQKVLGIAGAARPTSLQVLHVAAQMSQAMGTPIPLVTLRAMKAKLDYTGDGQFTGADTPLLQNAIAIVSDSEVAVAPPTQVRAVANPDGTVTLSWANNAQPVGPVILLRMNGATVAASIAVSSGNLYTDNPGPGTWTYQLQVVTPSYEGELSQPVSVTVGVQAPATGWTDLTTPAGSTVVYVSSSSGSDAAAGTQAAPLKTIAAGYAKLHDGQPDQLLLKCGDTWSESISFLKSAQSETAYMVLGSYGTGPRPRINAVGEPSVWLGQGRRGVAIVGIDFEDTAQGSGYTAITCFAPASHILIEGNRINGYPSGIVAQEITMGDRIRDLKIRRNVFMNIADVGTPHSEACFLGSVDGLVVEGNTGYKIALNKADEFCHFSYLSETDGTSVFQENVVAMVSSHFVQQRSGGTMTNNLSLSNPINGFQGNAQGGGGPSPVNYFGFNVALNSRNINSVDQRGFGFVLSGANGTICENNIVAFQVDGTSAIDGLDLDDFHGIVRGNVIWDWDGPNAGNPGWPTAIHVESNSTIVSMTGNTLVHHLNGMLIRWECPVMGTYSGNTYWTATPDGGVGGYGRFATNQGVSATLAQWRASTGDASPFLAAAPTQIAANIGDYLTSIGIAPGTNPVDTFMQHAVLQSKETWDARFTAPVVNAWIRGKFGVAQIPAS